MNLTAGLLLACEEARRTDGSTCADPSGREIERLPDPAQTQRFA
jgi:hypothetical protein